jgi:hypothetical protein
LPRLDRRSAAAFRIAQVQQPEELSLDALPKFTISSKDPALHSQAVALKCK